MGPCRCLGNHQGRAVPLQCQLCGCSSVAAATCALAWLAQGLAVLRVSLSRGCPEHPQEQCWFVCLKPCQCALVMQLAEWRGAWMVTGKGQGFISWCWDGIRVCNCQCAILVVWPFDAALWVIFDRMGSAEHSVAAATQPRPMPVKQLLEP